MKRFFFVLLIFGISIANWAQTTTVNTNKLIFKTETDTIVYELGVVSSPADMLYDFLQRMECYDTTATNDYIRGFIEGIKTPTKNKAYELGKQHGMQILIQTIPEVAKQIYGEESSEKLNVDLFLAGFLDMIEGKSRLIIDGEPITQSMAQMELQQRLQSLIEKREAETYLPNRLAGEEFLTKKAKEPGVKALEKGVLYKVIQKGPNGSKSPTLNNTIKIAYKGMTIDGEVFDENKESEFPLNQLIEGWKIALPKMSVGSKWIIYLPHEVAYGSRGSLPAIKPYSTLIFEIELLSILP
ncbi:MAG: FKBP-type peptidyl-prolyl cis-trans isomerase [Bacteroidaceae bacterium]|nr:FKBP-type peptidyl-prolyl cis-trans isomerase [Bacteroidaceae bacterium]